MKKITTIIFTLIIFLAACNVFAQYPAIKSGRPRIYADKARLDWCKANYNITGAFKKDYDDFMNRYNNWNWITNPDLYLAGSNSGLWTWNWNNSNAKNQIFFTVFIFKLSDDPLALERCNFLAQQVITAADNADFGSMEWYAKEDLLRATCESGGLLLDWCYNDLTPALRDKLVQALYKLNTEFMNTYILSNGGNSYVSSHNTNNAVICNQNALVLYNAPGLSPEQQSTVENWYHTVYDKHINGFFPCWEYYRDDDGGWNWTAAYSFWGFPVQFQLFENMKIATGKNFFTSLPWIKNSINQYIYLLQPDNKTIHWGDGVMTLPGADSVLYLHAKYFNDPRSKWLAQYWSSPENIASTLTLFNKLLYKDYSMPAVTRPNNPLDWWADKVGLSVSRSSWDNDSVMITFFNSMSKRASHEHRDNNNFTIYKHTPLIIDSGYYDSYGSSHFMNYYTRTIAHNTICVYDNTEAFFYDRIPASNDGGQIESPQMQSYDDIFKPANQRGKWIQYAAGTGYTYNVADAQLSYVPAKLDLFRRRLLYVKPDKVIVLDHVHLKNTATKQLDIKWIAHFVNRPDISGNIIRTEVPNHIITYNGTDYTAENGNGNVAIRTLIPANGNTTLIGGSGYEYWVNGINYPPGPGGNLSYYPGSWRIEVRPDAVADDGNVIYLHTIDIGESANPSKAGGIAFQNTISVGADWENALYFFAADGGTEKEQHVFEEVTGGRSVLIFAADMLPGRYGVKIDGTIAAIQKTDENGVLQVSVDIPPGSHTVEITKDGIPSNTGLKNVKYYPNPIKPSKGADYSNMYFTNLPEGSVIKIYTILGHIVRKLKADGNGVALWDGKNESGDSVASGVYIAYIEDKSGNKKKIKIAVER